MPIKRIHFAPLRSRDIHVLRSGQTRELETSLVLTSNPLPGTTADVLKLLRKYKDDATALGTNDVLSQGRLGPYEQLASSLAGHRLVADPVHEMPKAPQPAVWEANARIAKAVPRTAQGIVAATTDGIHLTAEDYARWLAAIETVACAGG